MSASACAHCGDPLTGKLQKKFCSRRCAGAAGASAQRGKRKYLACAELDCDRTDMAGHGLCYLHYKRKYQPEPRVVRNLTCQTCDVPFVQTGPGKDRKYCSRKCGRAVLTCAVRYADCDWCGRLFVSPTGKARAACSDQCARERKTLLRAGRIEVYRAARACPDCGGTLPKDAQRCEPCAVVHNRGIALRNARAYRQSENGRAASRAGKSRRRARLRGVRTERFDHRDVFERDAWVCGICSFPVDRSLIFPHPESPSLDHVLPLALGGEHTMANTQLAHLLCNSLKGARELTTVA